MNLFSALPSRARAVLLLLPAVLLLWLGAVAPYLDGLENTSRKIEAAQAQIQLYRRAAMHETEPDDPAAETSLAQYLIPGASHAAAAAYLQQQAGAVTQGAGAILLSFELPPLAGGDDAPLQAITGRIRMTADTQALRAWLHALESQRPLLLLDNIFVRARSPSDTVPGGHLDVQMDIIGFRKPGPEASP